MCVAHNHRRCFMKGKGQIGSSKSHLKGFVKVNFVKLFGYQKFWHQFWLGSQTVCHSTFVFQLIVKRELQNSLLTLYVLNFFWLLTQWKNFENFTNFTKDDVKFISRLTFTDFEWKFTKFVYNLEFWEKLQHTWRSQVAHKCAAAHRMSKTGIRIEDWTLKTS